MKSSSQVLLYLFVAISQALAQGQATSPFLESNALVVVADVQSYSRTRGPGSWEADGRFYVSNSCGYDTAVLKIEDVLIGEYSGTEIAAHLTLGEWCESLWQQSVVRYVVYLQWNGGAWEAKRELSSPVLYVEGKPWIVGPDLLRVLGDLGAEVNEEVVVPQPLKLMITKERLRQIGIEPDMGVSLEQLAAESASTCKAPGRCWSSAPMFYIAAISLEELSKWLSSNHAFKRHAGEK